MPNGRPMTDVEIEPFLTQAGSFGAEKECAFCERDRAAVDELFAGPMNGYVCSDCMGKCATALEQLAFIPEPTLQP